jgi:hypothetical protein
MRIPVTCPFCKKQGTVPEAMSGKRVTCRGCHRSFAVGASKCEPKPSTGLLAAMLDDDGGAYDVQPLRRVSTNPSRQSVPSSAMSPTVYAGLGIGAVCGLLMTGVFLHLLFQEPAKPHREEQRDAVVGRVAEPEPAPPPPPAPPIIHENDRLAAGGAQLKDALVDATVYLKLSSGGSLMGSGTGFVIRNERKNTVLLAINRHVADAETDDGGKLEITDARLSLEAQGWPVRL